MKKIWNQMKVKFRQLPMRIKLTVSFSGPMILIFILLLSVSYRIIESGYEEQIMYSADQSFEQAVNFLQNHLQNMNYILELVGSDRNLQDMLREGDYWGRQETGDQWRDYWRINDIMTSLELSNKMYQCGIYVPDELVYAWNRYHFFPESDLEKKDYYSDLCDRLDKGLIGFTGLERSGLEIVGVKKQRVAMLKKVYGDEVGDGSACVGTKALSEDYRRQSNIIGQENIPEKRVVATIITMLAIASFLGIWLVFRTDLFVLVIGMLCFAIGIFYTFGPIPLSRMPLGEVFSGVTMGFGITFLAIYVNAANQGIAHLGWSGRMITFEMDVLLLLEIFLVSLPCILTIANIMLANNICDLEEDIANKRFTLPYYIGRKNALLLFHLLYVLTFAAIVTAVLLQVLPVYALLVCLVLIPITKSIRRFRQKQSKLETFPLSLKNMMLVNGTMAITLLVSVIL